MIMGVLPSPFPGNAVRGMGKIYIGFIEFEEVLYGG
jgi:hypothetical protein